SQLFKSISPHSQLLFRTNKRMPTFYLTPNIKYCSTIQNPQKSTSNINEPTKSEVSAENEKIPTKQNIEENIISDQIPEQQQQQQNIESKPTEQNTTSDLSVVSQPQQQNIKSNHTEESNTEIAKQNPPPPPPPEDTDEFDGPS